MTAPVDAPFFTSITCSNKINNNHHLATSVRLIKAGIRQGKGHLGGGSNGQQWTYWATFPPFFPAFFHLNRVWERAKERSCHAQINQEPASAADENSRAFHFTQELLISPQQRKDLILIICKTNITAARGFHFNIKTPRGRNFLWRIALRRLWCAPWFFFNFTGKSDELEVAWGRAMLNFNVSLI